MAKVVITPSLNEAINKQFKAEATAVFSVLLSLEDNPKKGKVVGVVGGITIKEIRYKNVYRFYFVTESHKIKFLQREELENILIKFVRMSQKRDQQKTIDEIKHILRTLGDEGFS